MNTDGNLPYWPNGGGGGTGVSGPTWSYVTPSQQLYTLYHVGNQLYRFNPYNGQVWKECWGKWTVVEEPITNDTKE